MKRIEVVLLTIILLGAFLVRLYRFDGPIADWHSWRQADTSAVSRNFIKYGFDVLHPRIDNISNVQSGLDNPKGYFFVEFPLYNLAQAGLYRMFDFFTIEEWGRLVTIFAVELTIVFLFLLTKKYTDRTVAFATAFFYAFLPFTIYYGRTILPDTSMAMAILGGIYFFDKWLGKNERIKNKNEKFWVKMKTPLWFLLSLLFTASAMLLKPFALFFTLPLFYLAYKVFGWRMIKKWQLWIFLLLSISPLILWRLWMTHFPEGIPANAWLFNGGNIRFRPAYFRWVFYMRLTQLILGFGGAVIFLGGLFISAKSERLFKFAHGQSLLYYSFLASALLYLIVIARGNVQHDYYQILIIPSVVLFLGLGVKFFFSGLYIDRKIGIAIVVLSIIVGLSYGWYQVRDYFNINNPAIVIAGRAVDRLTPKTAKIIAPLDGDSSFLYQTNRFGWASFEKDLPQMRDQLGADYLVLANTQPKDYNIGKTYKIVAATKDYILFDLHQKP